MNVQDYLVSHPEIKAMMRRKALYKLETLYADEVLSLDDEEVPEDFETFLERTIQDMVYFENYEGAQMITDIITEHGWKLK